MEEQRVINRASYARPYLVHKVFFEARGVVLVDPDELDAMQRNSGEFQQLVQKGYLVMQGGKGGKVRLANNSNHDFTIRYPLVLLQPGENSVPSELWTQVLDKYGSQVWDLQGQPDGLVF